MITRIILTRNIESVRDGFDLKGQGPPVWRIAVKCSVDDATPAVEAPDPIGGAHALDADRGAGPGCVNKAMVSEIDPHVGERASLGVVENQIARFKRGHGHRFSHSALRPGVVRQFDTECFPVDMGHEAAAIKTALWRLPAAPIRYARCGERLKHDLRTAGGAGLFKGWPGRATGNDTNTEKQGVAAHN